MTIVIAGGSGFLGAALASGWRADGNRVLVLTRHPRREDEIGWNPDGGDDNTWVSALDGADAVVNLAGAGIADKRWTAARKAAILDSRIHATRAIVAAVNASRTPPRVLLNASAVGIYGDRGDEPLTEESPSGNDFLSDVCRRWEAEAAPAADTTRLVLLRTGIVLAKEDGALPQMALPFRFFAGGKVGSGRQFISWIHLADWLSMVRWAAADAGISGPLNVTAPAPATNAAFSDALGRALHKPALVPAPAFALRLALGEMADALLGGQCALPAKAQQKGFEFSFPTIDAALRDIFRSG